MENHINSQDDIKTKHPNNDSSVSTLNTIDSSYERTLSQVSKSSEKLVDDNLPARDKWGSKWEFLLSCVGLSVGVGNLWRFPYKAYENGGGAFLIPYIIMLLLAGKPMYFMELAICQYAGRGPLHVWKCSPIARGVGFGMLVMSLIVAIYYNVIMAYTLFYMFASFQSTVPWSTCDPAWANNTTCYERGINKNFTANITGEDMQSSSEQYWKKYVLQTSSSIEDIGYPIWSLSLCLLLSWIIVVACLIKGVKSSGKVVYFTATFPYVILFVLLIRGVTLDGAAEGIMFFIKPSWKQLLDIKVWHEAACQMFYSLGIAFGGLHVFGSYCEFKHPIYRDAMIVSILDTVTSIIGGFVIFSVLGNMAHVSNVPIQNVTKSGFGLAFVTYPEALAQLPVPQLWTFLFFFMLFTLGLDSEFALMETVLTTLFDEFPKLRKNKSKITIGISVLCYLLGLPCVTNGGQFVLNIMDNYTSSIAALIIAFFEVIGFMWIYGLNRFCDDLEFMLGFRPGIYWRATWMVLCPLSIGFITIYSFVVTKAFKPAWANAIGWCIAMLAVMQIPVWAIITIFQQKSSTFIKKLKMAIEPSLDWGPSDPTAKRDRLAAQSSMGLTATSRSASGGIDNLASSNSFISNV